MCDFCEKKIEVELLRPSNERCYISIDKDTGYTVLRDTNRDRKYLFDFDFCPVCGKNLKEGI